MIRDLIGRGVGFKDGTRFIPTLGLGKATTAVPTPPPGPGRPHDYTGECESPRKKKRRRLMQALIVAEFDFQKAEEYVGKGCLDGT